MRIQILLLCFIGLAFMLTGCEAIFTYSPFSFLQRDPANLPLEQKIAWAEAALSSGDREAMEKAYKALKDDATGSIDAKLTLLAANLAMELAGITDVLLEVIDDIESTTFDDQFYDQYKDRVDPTYVAEAGSFYVSTQALDAEALSGMENILAVSCLIYDAGLAAGGFSDVELAPADVAPAQSFISTANTVLPTDSLAYETLDEIDTNYLATIT